MSVDFSKPTIDFSKMPNEPETESVMFAAAPAWERSGKKRRGLGRSAAKPAAAQAVPTRPVNEPAPAYVAPAQRSIKAKQRTSVAPMAIGLGALALGVVAAGGWYAMQPHDTGVAELTPGAPTDAITVAAGPTLPAPAPMSEAMAPAPAASPTEVRQTPAPARTVARARPAQTQSAPSAGDAGVNTSASEALPSAPLPYSATTGQTPSTTVNPTPPAAMSTPPAESTVTTPSPEIAPTAPSTPSMPEVAPSNDPVITP